MKKPQNQAALIRSLQKFGLNPTHWELKWTPSIDRPWVILKNRSDRDYRLAGRVADKRICELHLLSL